MLPEGALPSLADDSEEESAGFADSRDARFSGMAPPWLKNHLCCAGSYHRKQTADSLGTRRAGKMRQGAVVAESPDAEENARAAEELGQAHVLVFGLAERDRETERQREGQRVGE